MLPLLLLVPMASAGLIGIDIGTEGIKAAAIRSGRSIEIVLNEQSKRKTPALVSFESELAISAENVRSIDRRVGASAQGPLLRNRSAVARNFVDVIGKERTDELLEHLAGRYIDIPLIEPYAALAMLFESIQHSASLQFQETSIRDAVIAVPGYFTDKQRRQVAKAARLGGLNLIKIIDDRTAISLVYALEKTSFFTRETKKVAFVDFGASSLRVSSFKFSAKISSKRGRSPKPVPRIEDTGYYWSDRIGGLDLDVLLAEHLRELYSLPRVSTLLLSDAQKIKHALTLSDDINISLDAVDTRFLFTRAEFHELCKPVFDKIRSFLAEIPETFDSVEFVGGASRIPLFQELCASLGPASQSLNNDECIVVGAAYTAAIASDTFHLLDVTHDPTTTHQINLALGKKNIKLISEGSSMTKLKTARLETTGDRDILLSYASKLPVGCDALVRTYRIQTAELPENSRSAFSFGFDTRTAVQLSKSMLFQRSESGEISQAPLDVKRTKLHDEGANRTDYKELLNAFAVNDARLARIAEARNELESIVFELRSSLDDGDVWSSVMNAEEDAMVHKLLADSLHWLETHTEFEDEKELLSKAHEVTELISPIKFRVEESYTRESSKRELVSLLDEIVEAVLNQWPTRKLKVPKQQRKALLQHAVTTREWLQRMDEEQSVLSPWDDPVLKTSDLQLRIRKLGDSYRYLEEAVLTGKLRNKRRNDDDDEGFGADL